MSHLVAIPVYNEERHLAEVLRQVTRLGGQVLVVDDGSTDRTAAILSDLSDFPDVTVLQHVRNQGYGAALRSAFRFAGEHGFDVVVTLDADGQHAPSFIPDFLAAARDHEIVSGSRYAQWFSVNTAAPPERQRINRLVTDQLNAALGLNLTDAFCGFKAYRTSALARMRLRENGYAMPLELWVQAAFLGLEIGEIPVPCVYLDPHRSFSETLDDADVRLAYYQRVIDAALAEAHAAYGALTTTPVTQRAVR